jgi:hypothetical protein
MTMTKMSQQYLPASSKVLSVNVVQANLLDLLPTEVLMVVDSKFYLQVPYLELLSKLILFDSLLSKVDHEYSIYHGRTINHGNFGSYDNGNDPCSRRCSKESTKPWHC